MLKPILVSYFHGQVAIELGLAEACLERPWAELSGGEKQRACLAVSVPSCLL